MKTIQCLFLSLLVTVAFPLASCVVPVDGPPVASVGVGYYSTLPAYWDDPYYYYGGRYYYGGVWETGHFRYRGRVHDGRYVHNGHYYYGGRYDAGHHKSSHHDDHKRDHH